MFSCTSPMGSREGMQTRNQQTMVYAIGGYYNYCPCSLIEVYCQSVRKADEEVLNLLVIPVIRRSTKFPESKK